MASKPTRTAIAALTLLAVAACSGTAPDPEPAPPPAPTASATTEESPTADAAELGEHVPLAPGTTRTWPEAVETVSGEGREFTLFGVHRIGEERVVVTGRITGSHDSTAAGSWFEPGYTFSRGGYEFSRVTVIDVDGVRHLPVRDSDDHCLCSLSTQPYEDLTDPQAPAWAVLSAPADATTLDVEIIDVGTVEDVPITDPPAEQSVPFGWEEVLTIDSLTREGGVLTARTTIANPGETDPTYLYGRHGFDYFEASSQHCFQGLAAWVEQSPTGRAAKDEECTTGGMPPAGEQVTLEVKIADPGTEEVLILPDAGLPITVAATGSPAPGAEESLRTYAARAESAGAVVAEGEELTVDLDTAVLFDVDKATLTPAAADALDVAVRTLEGQESREIVVAGHTDSVGSEEDNLALSEERAKAVAEALEAELGAEWDIAVEWHGENQPVAEEAGDDAQVEAARARNRRVEITVG